MTGAAAGWVVAVAVLVRHGDRLLTLRRAADNEAAPGAWETVSGRLELGETLEEAAAREVREETGLALELDPRPVTAYPARRAGAPMVVVVYRGLAASPDARRSTEHDAHVWASPEEFAALCPFPRLVEAVRAAWDGWIVTPERGTE